MYRFNPLNTQELHIHGTLWNGLITCIIISTSLNAIFKGYLFLTAKTSRDPYFQLFWNEQYSIVKESGVPVQDTKEETGW